MNNYKKDFPWFTKNPNLIYLDNSATTLKPYSVIKAISMYYENLSTNPHALDSKIGQETNSAVNSARINIANFFSCDKSQLIFTPGATHSLNYVSHFLKQYIKENDEIIITDADHSSSSTPLINIAKENKAKIVIVKNNGNKVIEEDILRKINERTKVVSIMNASNTLGYYINDSLTKKIKDVNPNIFVSIDATQAIAHKKMNFKEIGADFISGSAHKILGPTGIGFLFIKDCNNNSYKPLINGGGAVSNYSNEEIYYSKSPEKYEAGTPNVAGILGFSEAINYINNIKMEKIEEIEQKLKLKAINEMKQIKEISIVNESPDLGIICFNYSGLNAQDLAHYLSAKNIVARSGLSCAKMLRDSQIQCNSFVRISFYFYNTEEDVEKLVRALRDYKKGDELIGLFD